MIKYRNTGGEHVMLDGTVIKHGEVFGAGEDLQKKFPNKFERVLTDAAPATTATPPTTSNKPTAHITDSTTDVTADFPSASAANLIVKVDKAGWWFYEEGETTPINNKPLKEKDVAKAVDKYLNG